MWFVSELYHPEDTSTGYLVTGIAEGLAQAYSVAVLCSQPTYAARGTRAARHEVRHGVAIWRCAGTTLDKNHLPFRLLNLVTISLSVLGNALRRFRRGDVVVVTTNPPTLPFVALVACRIRGAHCVLMIHDVYPQALFAAGLLSPTSRMALILGSLQRALYRSMAKIIVLGRDAKSLVAQQAALSPDRLVQIPNWADVDHVRPAPRANNALLMALGIADKFVVQYSGNMGRTHGLECLIDAAAQLSSDSSIHFLFIGSGARRNWLVETIAKRGLSNASVLPYQRRDELTLSLNACDLAIVSFAPGMVGVSVPSRMYNILASGKPIVAVADPESELASVVREENVGWVVPPNSPDQVASAILEAKRSPHARAEMGTRARLAAEQKYRYEQVIASYRSVLSTVS